MNVGLILAFSTRPVDPKSNNVIYELISSKESLIVITPKRIKRFRIKKYVLMSWDVMLTENK